MKILLDTHVWLWWLIAPERLTPAERDTLDVQAGRGALGVSAICLWEAQMLYAKGRLRLPMPFGAWLREAAGPEVVSVVPLSVDVVLAVDALPKSFHGDPADRVIVATARAHSVPLATRDRAIRASRLAKLWRP